MYSGFCCMRAVVALASIRGLKYRHDPLALAAFGGAAAS